jgi:hypothetical protein
MGERMLPARHWRAHPRTPRALREAGPAQRANIGQRIECAAEAD